MIEIEETPYDDQRRLINAKRLLAEIRATYEIEMNDARKEYDETSSREGHWGSVKWRLSFCLDRLREFDNKCKELELWPLTE